MNLKEFAALKTGEERYLVRFHGKDDKPALGEEYERWIDRGFRASGPPPYEVSRNLLRQDGAGAPREGL